MKRRLGWRIMQGALVGMVVLTLRMDATLSKATAEMENVDCEEIVNSIIEADQRRELDPPLNQTQILLLNNVCERSQVTESDIEEIAPQYWHAGEKPNNILLQEDKDERH